MQTVREQKKIDLSLSSRQSSLPQAPVSKDQAKKIQIREFISWAICFGVVAGLTGVMKILKVGITMDMVTSSLFWISIAGVIFFISRIIAVSKSSVTVKNHSLHELN